MSDQPDEPMIRLVQQEAAPEFDGDTDGYIRKLSMHSKTFEELRQWALEQAIRACHELPPALFQPVRRRPDPDGDFDWTPEMAEEGNQWARDLEDATIDRVLRIADHFALYMVTGLSPRDEQREELEAELRSLLNRREHGESEAT